MSRPLDPSLRPEEPISQPIPQASTSAPGTPSPAEDAVSGIRDVSLKPQAASSLEPIVVKPHTPDSLLAVYRTQLAAGKITKQPLDNYLDEVLRDLNTRHDQDQPAVKAYQRAVQNIRNLPFPLNLKRLADFVAAEKDFIAVQPDPDVLLRSLEVDIATAERECAIRGLPAEFILPQQQEAAPPPTAPQSLEPVLAFLSENEAVGKMGLNNVEKGRFVKQRVDYWSEISTARGRPPLPQELLKLQVILVEDIGMEPFPLSREVKKKIRDDYALIGAMQNEAARREAPLNPRAWDLLLHLEAILLPHLATREGALEYAKIQAAKCALLTQLSLPSSLLSEKPEALLASSGIWAFYAERAFEGPNSGFLEELIKNNPDHPFLQSLSTPSQAADLHSFRVLTKEVLDGGRFDQLSHETKSVLRAVLGQINRGEAVPEAKLYLLKHRLTNALLQPPKQLGTLLKVFLCLQSFLGIGTTKETISALIHSHLIEQISHEIKYLSQNPANKQYVQALTDVRNDLKGLTFNQEHLSALLLTEQTAERDIKFGSWALKLAPPAVQGDVIVALAEAKFDTMSPQELQALLKASGLTGSPGNLIGLETDYRNGVARTIASKQKLLTTFREGKRIDSELKNYEAEVRDLSNKMEGLKKLLKLNLANPRAAALYGRVLVETADFYRFHVKTLETFKWLQNTPKAMTLVISSQSREKGVEEALATLKPDFYQNIDRQIEETNAQAQKWIEHASALNDTLGIRLKADFLHKHTQFTKDNFFSVMSRIVALQERAINASDTHFTIWNKQFTIPQPHDHRQKLQKELAEYLGSRFVMAQKFGVTLYGESAVDAYQKLINDAYQGFLGRSDRIDGAEGLYHLMLAGSDVAKITLHQYFAIHYMHPTLFSPPPTFQEIGMLTVLALIEERGGSKDLLKILANTFPEDKDLQTAYQCVQSGSADGIGPKGRFNQDAAQACIDTATNYLKRTGKLKQEEPVSAVVRQELQEELPVSALLPQELWRAFDLEMRGTVETIENLLKIAGQGPNEDIEKALRSQIVYYEKAVSYVKRELKRYPAEMVVPLLDGLAAQRTIIAGFKKEQEKLHGLHVFAKLQEETAPIEEMLLEVRQNPALRDELLSKIDALEQKGNRLLLEKEFSVAFQNQLLGFRSRIPASVAFTPHHLEQQWVALHAYREEIESDLGRLPIMTDAERLALEGRLEAYETLVFQTLRTLDSIETSLPYPTEEKRATLEAESARIPQLRQLLHQSAQDKTVEEFELDLLLGESKPEDLQAFDDFLKTLE